MKFINLLGGKYNSQSGCTDSFFVFEMANNHQGSLDHGLNIIREMGKIADEYNAHGQDGWELVSVMDTNKNNGQTDLVIAFFKRTINS